PSPSFSPSLPPSSGILASSVRALVSLEGAGQRSHSRYLKGNQPDRPPRFIKRQMQGRGQSGRVSPWRLEAKAVEICGSMLSLCRGAQSSD
ncbi:hypothetical protein LEMLEM_LOCUS13614, partial [Lemmus lemmus]